MNVGLLMGVVMGLAAEGGFRPTYPWEVELLHVTEDIDALCYPPGVGTRRPKNKKRRSIRSCGKRRRRSHGR